MESAMNAKTAKKTVETETVVQPEPAQAVPVAQKKVPEPKLLPTFAVEAGTVAVQERTRLVPLPTTFFFEADPAAVTKPRGHQVDPSRVEACSPVMPNLTLLAATGNPYPAEPDETVVTGEKYQPFVKISHLTYARLVADGEFKSSDKEAIASILAAAGIAEDYDSLTAVKDTLRDLALYGLAKQFTVGRARLFRFP
jgi:hypothetical protein